MKDHTIGIFVTALVLVALSAFEIGTAVHTYCEDRWKLPVLAVAAGLTLGFAIRNWPRVLGARVFRTLTIALCAVVVSSNLWFIVTIGHYCRSLFSLAIAHFTLLQL